jgi:hypothetical protein
MKILYIPQHLFPALKKAGLRSQELGDVEKLMSTLSAEDVAFYFFANDPAKCPIPKPLAATLPNFLFGEGHPFKNNETDKNVLGKFNSLKHNGNTADMYEETAVLTSDCSYEDLLIVTHTAPADAEAGDQAVKSETAFYDRVIQQLLAFQKLETVLASPALIGWMKSVQADALAPSA